MKAWEEGSDFKEAVLGDSEILTHMTSEEIDAAFDLNHALRWVDAIFDRVFS
jgi:adenylosuccinate lyase